MMELVGMGDIDNTDGNNQESSGFEESSLDFAKTTTEELLIQVVENTLRAYSVDEKLASLEVLNLIDQDAKDGLSQIMIEPLRKNYPPQLWS